MRPAPKRPSSDQQPRVSPKRLLRRDARRALRRARRNWDAFYISKMSEQAEDVALRCEGSGEVAESRRNAAEDWVWDDPNDVGRGHEGVS